MCIKYVPLVYKRDIMNHMKSYITNNIIKCLNEGCPPPWIAGGSPVSVCLPGPWVHS